MGIDFRKIGFSADAINFPLSPEGQEIIAEHNGVTVEVMPDEFRYSSSAHMHHWIEALGSRKKAGLSTRHPSGRWLVPSEIGL